MAKDPNFGVQGNGGGMGGQYARKAENLTKKQLKAAGAAKAAKKAKVDISQTRRDYSKGITLGPKGKPLTGSVRLANGNIAVYKAGKRVQVAKKPASGSGRTTTTTGKNPPPSMSAAEKARLLRIKQNKGVKAGTVRTGAKGQTVRKYNAKTGRWEVMVSSGSAVARAQAQARAQAAGSAGKTKWQTAVETALKNRRGPAAVSSGAGRNATGNKPASAPATPARNPYSIRGQLESIAKLYGYSDAWVQRTEAQGATAARAVISNLYKKVVEGR